jgi:hypothetical protein
MRRKVYLIGGFGLGWRKVMLQLIDAAETAISSDGLKLQLRTPESANSESFSVVAEDGGTEVEFTVLKWNDISKQYYRNGFIAFWLKVVKMYVSFLVNSDWKVVARLPGKIVFIFLIAPFAIILLFLFFTFISWFLLSGLADVPLEYSIITSVVVSVFGTYLVLDSAGIILFLRGLLFSADSLVLKSDLLDNHINAFKNRIMNDVRSKDYDEVVVLGFSHGCKLLVLLMSELYRTGEREVQDKFKAVFVAQFLPLGLLLKARTKLREAVLQLKQLDVTYFNVFNSCDSVCSSKNTLFFPYDDGMKACVVDLDTGYEKYLKGLNKLKAKLTFHYAHTLYFRSLDMPCPHGMIRILCSPLRLEENPAFSQSCESGADRDASRIRTVC